MFMIHNIPLTTVVGWFYRAVVFVKPNSSVQILTAIFVCIIFLGLVSYFKPYEEDDDDTFAFISYICLVFTLVLGVGLVRFSVLLKILRNVSHTCS